MRFLSEGAESRVFITNVFGREAVVKLRHSKHYRIKALDESLRKTRTRKEAKAMQKASEACVRVPALLGVGKFSLYIDKINGVLLKDVRKQRVDYAEIGGMLARMHNANVAHGDFTPANIIINKAGAWIIDFGLADISDSIEDKALDLLLMKRLLETNFYRRLEHAYLKESRQGKHVISRLAEIERRGRYQTRTLV